MATLTKAPSLGQLTLDESSKQISDLFTQAESDFERETQQKLDTTLLDIKSVDDYLDLMESKIQFGAFRKHAHPNLIKHLQLAMLPVKLLGSFACAASSQVFPASGLIFNAVTYLIDAVNGVSLTFDIIEHLFSKIEDLNTDLGILSQHTLPAELKIKLAQLMVATIRICAVSRRLSKDGRFLTTMKGALRGSDPDVSDQLAVFDDLRAGLTARVGALTYNSVLDLQSGSAEIRATLRHQGEEEGRFRRDLRSNIDGDNIIKLEQLKLLQAERIKAVLSPTVSHRKLYEDFRSTRTIDTGQWILNNSAFKSWHDGELPVLWLSGGPGTGKSSLSTYIIDYLRSSKPLELEPGMKCPVLYFFFKEENPELRSFARALCTMAVDAAERDARIFKLLYQTCSELPDIASSITTLWNEVFAKIFSENKCTDPVYLVFDGLDEADQDELLLFLRVLKGIEQKKLSTQILLISRPETGIVLKQTLAAEIHEISLSKDTNQKDIDAFVVEGIKALPDFASIRSGMRRQIRAKLTKNADGMFLWVQLMLRELRDSYTDKSILAILENPPKTINNMISHILQRASKNLRGDRLKDFNCLLAVATWVHRPLRVSAYEALIRIMLEDETAAQNLKSSLQGQYASFFDLEVDEDETADSYVIYSLREQVEFGDSTDEASAYNYAGYESDHSSDEIDESDPYISFLHVSIRQYFRSGIDTQVGDAGIVPQRSKADLALATLRYIAECQQPLDVPATGTLDAEVEGRELDSTRPRKVKENTVQHNTTIDSDDDWENGSSDEKSSPKDNVGAHDVKGSDHEAKADPVDDDDASDLPDSYQLGVYAASEWQSHLQELDPTTASEEYRVKVLQCLLRLFLDQHVIEYWVGNTEDFARLWFSDTAGAEVVRKWSKVLPSNNNFTPSQIEWLHAVSKDENLSSLLKPSMDVLVGIWLDSTSIEFATTHIYKWLRVFTSDRSVAEVKLVIENAPIEQTESVGLSILRTASAFRPTPTSLSHVRTAQVLRSASCFAEAHAAVNAALALSPTYWYAFKERGLIYYEQNQLPDAVVATERAVELRAKSPASEEPDWRNYWSMRRMLAYWLKNLGRAEECLKHCRALIKACGPGINLDTQALLCSVWVMNNTGQYADIMASLREIHEKKNIRHDASELVLAISALAVNDDSGMLDKMIFRAAWIVGREELAWIQTVYESALKRANTLRRTVLQVELELRLAKQLALRMDQPERAVELWEGVMERHRDARFGSQLYGASRACLRDLFNAYTKTALSNREDAQMVQRYLEKVQVIASGSPKHLNDGDDEISLELGILHRLLGRDEQATKCFRPFIKSGIELLTDDDEGNDWDGYISLTNGLTHAGASHCMDLLASFSLLGVTEKEKDVAELAAWKLWYASCDGCDKQLYVPDDTWACLWCQDMAFCNVCGPKAQSGSLGFTVCSPKHEMMYIPKNPQPLPKGMVRFDGELRPMKYWLAELRAKWKV